MVTFFWAGNVLLLLFSFFTARVKGVDRRRSFALLQALFFLPLLVLEYLGVALRLVPVTEGVAVLFVSQWAFLGVWGSVTLYLRDTLTGKSSLSSFFVYFFHSVIVVLALVGIFLNGNDLSVAVNQNAVVIEQFEAVYFAAVGTLLVVLLAAWQFEIFWRQLPKLRRRLYELLVVGALLVCVVQGVGASYLVTYLELTNDLLLLQAVFLLVAWGMIVVAVIRHRLLRRQFFVSQKGVYTFFTPFLFAAYFLALGGISFFVRIIGCSTQLVFFCFLGLVGGSGVVLLLVSKSLRLRLKNFVGAHFYVDKYEYREEWLAFSLLLQSANTEEKVLNALHRVLSESLYTREIWIWVGSEVDGFELVKPESVAGKSVCRIAGLDPAVAHLRQAQRVDVACLGKVESQVYTSCLSSLPSPGPILLVPLVADGQLVGCIGLGAEYTGGDYGQDDFDLLTALSSQAASALTAARLTEETARLRERRALQNVSAFLLHDIKNAASILSMVLANAPQHMDNPEFRKDMLTAIGDALQRMDKAQASLGILRDRVQSVWQNVALCRFLDEVKVRFTRRLSGLDVELVCPDQTVLRTDPQLLETVFENLLLNAYEAGGGNCHVCITVAVSSDGIQVRVANNGPPIPEALLPDRLFQRFVTDKPDGSGIGLWQARLVLQRLGATIVAENPPAGGASFVIHLPVSKGVGFSNN